MPQNPEYQRIHDGFDQKVPPWRKWGAYLSERAWGTVREDYSADGNAWHYLPHDLARSKAYRWGEDGLAGWTDYYQTLIVSFAFWNGKDPILKERLFGLDPTEGNHGEDVKENYFYLDATPTHAYMKYLYKYPQQAFPYAQLIAENKRRTTQDREYELVDTGIFDEGRYFDIFVEYGKAGPEDVCIRVEIFNRGNEAASIHLLPQLWFRNRWSWGPTLGNMPEIRLGQAPPGCLCLVADSQQLDPPDWLAYDYHLKPAYLYGAKPAEALFTHNETNNERVWGGQAASRTSYVKDAFHRYVVNGEKCVNPDQTGTKACFHYAAIEIPPQQSRVLRFRLSASELSNPLEQVDAVIQQRKEEADAFYQSIHNPRASEEDRLIQRQAFAGMIWNTQCYFYDVKRWLQGDNPHLPPPASRYEIRNQHWENLHAHDILSMPDTWEYPWFASWDSAFHSLVFSQIDLPFAKRQLLLFLKHQYQHPNGQIPAYEWAFSDANPPVQAFALWQLYQSEIAAGREGDREFLESCFLKLMQNFSWWVNKVDRCGNNVFEGGFLGLDNISIIDRSKPLPGGGHIEQSDGTGWMGFFSLLMMRIALELSKTQPLYQRLAIVYFEYFIAIANAMEATKVRSIELWDKEDGFFYDVVAYPDGTSQRLKVRSFVGLIPFFAIEFFEEEELQNHPHFYAHYLLYIQHYCRICSKCITPISKDGKQYLLFSLMTPEQIQRILPRVWDSAEFLSPYGLRSLSKYHEEHPVQFANHEVRYEPGESLEKIKGGNSNWRGPVWFPTNYLFWCTLKRLDAAYQGKLTVEIQGKPVAISELADDLSMRLITLFRQGGTGSRPANGDHPLFSQDPHFRDQVLLYEHYHGDTGRGLGASHQTGWSGLVANLIAHSSTRGY